MANVEFCEHDWPGSGCKKCAEERAVQKEIDEKRYDTLQLSKEDEDLEEIFQWAKTRMESKPHADENYPKMLLTCDWVVKIGEKLKTLRAELAAAQSVIKAAEGAGGERS